MMPTHCHCPGADADHGHRTQVGAAQHWRMIGATGHWSQEGLVSGHDT